MNDPPRLRLRGVSALMAIGPALCIGPAVAGPPFATDDPEPTEYRHYEVYLSAQQTRTSAGREGTLPLLEINYGAVPDLQIGIGFPLAFSEPENGSRQSGLGDIALSAKYRLVAETGNSPMVAVFPSVTARTGDPDEGLGSGATNVFIPVWLQKSWGEWQSYGGGGYHVDRSAGARNHWFLGWQLQKEVSAGLDLGGEIFHVTEEAPGGGSSSGFSLGGVYSFSERDHLLFSAGKGLSNVGRTNRFSCYVGYQWIW